jgi:hypothetical protein
MTMMMIQSQDTRIPFVRSVPTLRRADLFLQGCGLGSTASTGASPATPSLGRTKSGSRLARSRLNSIRLTLPGGSTSRRPSVLP